MGAAQLSYVALADVQTRSGRGAAFLRAAGVAALLLVLPAVAGAAGPAVTSSPTLEGRAIQGSTLIATPGSWQGSGELRYVYRWYRCDPMGRRCVLLRGANAPKRKLGAADVGHTVAVNVRATDSAGSTNGYSSLVGPIAGSPSPLVSTAQPGVTGSLAVGGALQVDTGKWSKTPTSFTYQWVRCNSN